MKKGTYALCVFLCVFLFAVANSTHGALLTREVDFYRLDSYRKGMAVAAKHKKSSYRVFAVLGDGELQEGQIWEAAMSAARRLMLKHNIAQATAPGSGRYTFRHIGRPTGRRSAAERILGLILSEHFFVEVIWTHVYVHVSPTSRSPTSPASPPT